MMITISIIALLMVMSAFFSCSETAFTAYSRPLMHEMEHQGNKRAALVNRLGKKREHLIGALLLGNNAVNITASAMATSVMISLFGEAGVVYATAGMTLVVLIFGEILPKTFALRNATNAALIVARPVRLMVIVLSPLVQAIHAIVRMTLTLLGARKPGDPDLTIMMAELRGAIDLHTNHDVRHERAMLRSVLDLAEVTVGEIMTHRKSMVAIDANLAAGTVVDSVLNSPYTRIPLWRGKPENIVGVLHAKALLRAVRAHVGDLDTLDVVAVASPPWFIPESTTLQEQLQAFRDRREHFALVVDEYGDIQGIIALEDILEEIVGDITDEHDVSVSGVRPQPDGSYAVNGDVTIRDLNREFDWRLPDEEASTLAGLMLHEARRIPDVGQVFLFHGFRFEILRRLRNQITAVSITPPVSAAAPSKEKGERA